MGMEPWCNDIERREQKNSEDNPLPLRKLRIPRGLTLARSRASVVTDRRLRLDHGTALNYLYSWISQLPGQR